MTLIVFSLGNVHYSLDVRNVEEVVPLPFITPLTNLPFFIRGIINLRGKAVSVIDLKKRFGFGDNPDELNNKIIIVKFYDKITGFIVDEVLFVSDVCEDKFIPPPDMVEGIDMQYMSAAVQIKSDLTIILNLDNILSYKESEELLKLDINMDDIKA